MCTGICSVIFMMTAQATTCKYHYHEHVTQKSIPDHVIRTSILHCISHDTEHMILTSSFFLMRNDIPWHMPKLLFIEINNT